MSRRKADIAMADFAKKYHYRVKRDAKIGLHVHRGRAYILDKHDGTFTLYIRFSFHTCSSCGSHNDLLVDSHEWQLIKGDLVAWGLTFLRADQDWGVFRFNPIDNQHATAVQRCLESVTIALRSRPQKQAEVQNTNSTEQAAASKQTTDADQFEGDYPWLLDAEPAGGIQ